MNDWTARIDALLDEPPQPEPGSSPREFEDWWAHCAVARGQRLALAAERLREPHGHNCRALWSLTAPDCTCGKDADLLRILEGK